MFILYYCIVETASTIEFEEMSPGVRVRVREGEKNADQQRG